MSIWQASVRAGIRLPCSHQAASARPNPGIDPARSSTAAGATRGLLVEAQSVPTATEVVCIGSLPTGSTLGRVQAFRGSSVITLGNDRAGDSALQLTLTRHCAVGRTAAVRAPGPGISRQRALRGGARFAATWYDLFPGGCVQIALRPATQRAAVDQGLARQVPAIVGYISCATLRHDLAQLSVGRL